LLAFAATINRPSSGTGASTIATFRTIAPSPAPVTQTVVNPSDEQTVFAIPFKTLWLNWKVGFNNKYDIPDAEVAQALRTGSTLEATRGPAVARSALTTDDYDLDRSAGHVVAT